MGSADVYDLQSTNSVALTRVSADLNMVTSGLGEIDPATGKITLSEQTVDDFNRKSTLSYKASTGKCSLDEFELSGVPSVRAIVDKLNNPWADQNIKYQGLKPAFFNSRENHLYQVFDVMSAANPSQKDKEVYYSIETGLPRYAVMYQTTGKNYVFDFGEQL